MDTSFASRRLFSKAIRHPPDTTCDETKEMFTFDSTSRLSENLRRSDLVVTDDPLNTMLTSEILLTPNIAKESAAIFDPEHTTMLALVIAEIESKVSTLDPFPVKVDCETRTDTFDHTTLPPPLPAPAVPRYRKDEAEILLDTSWSSHCPEESEASKTIAGVSEVKVMLHDLNVMLRPDIDVTVAKRIADFDAKDDESTTSTNLDTIWPYSVICPGVEFINDIITFAMLAPKAITGYGQLE